jgi:hypothetical protein
MMQSGNIQFFTTIRIALNVPQDFSSKSHYITLAVEHQKHAYKPQFNYRLAEGTVELYVYRVTTAILALRQEYIRWPQPHSEKYLETIQRHQFEYGFTNCLKVRFRQFLDEKKSRVFGEN